MRCTRWGRFLAYLIIALLFQHLGGDKVGRVAGRHEHAIFGRQLWVDKRLPLALDATMKEEIKSETLLSGEAHLFCKTKISNTNGIHRVGYIGVQDVARLEVPVDNLIRAADGGC